MAGRLPDSLLSQLNEFVTSQMGLHFPKERWCDLERGIDSAAREFDFKDTESCIQWLISSPLTKNRIEILAGYLTVGETYFFREKKSFEIFEEHILQKLICSRRGTEPRLRIWSAGCCTGEEPYSIAILLDKLIPDPKDWNITILATDINPRFLQKASEGVYNEWSFRDAPTRIKERYFERKKGGRYKILPEIKKRVTFSYLNLAEDAYPSLTNNTNAMDVIFCRNVLMYFGPERARKVIQNLFRSLINGGWLIVSPSETSQALFSQFATVNFPGVILYRKDSDLSRTGQAMGVFPSMPVEEAGVSFQPPVHFFSDPAPEAVFTQETGASLPLEGEKKKTAEPRPAPYAEAAALYERGRYAEAAEKIAVLLSDHPDDAKAMALLARVYANEGRLAEALEWCEKAIAADKLNPGGYYLLATILQEQDQAGKATVSLKRAIYLDPNFVLAYFALGNLAQQQGKSKDSEKYFENALSILSKRRQDDILLESEGMTAGRLVEIIRSMMLKETAA
ncbi:MAG TPA: CheR family methyltransferase [Nitrospiria bacterium]